MHKDVIEVLEKDITLYKSKGTDYAPNDYLENFITSSNFASKVTNTPLDAITSLLILIGTKISRLETVGIKKEAKNESFSDTLRDLRVYLAILEVALKDYKRSDT